VASEMKKRAYLTIIIVFKMRNNNILRGQREESEDKPKTIKTLMT
jgi:hypothetical protein